jgi:D-aminopeptidase
MEGIAGVGQRRAASPRGEFEYERFPRKLMTGEVNAAMLDGALAAGATKFSVADSHGETGLSILARRAEIRKRD